MFTVNCIDSRFIYIIPNRTSLNVYSQIGLMLIGLIAKNGILVVDLQINLEMMDTVLMMRS